MIGKTAEKRFCVLQGMAHFKPESLLAEVGVQFVRPRQYTIVPYPFHLIDLYVENVRRYETPFGMQVTGAP